MDPLGKLLLATGALSEAVLDEVLDEQRRAMPMGSMCYILGILDEETLARALCRQFGMPSVVLERSVVPLHVLSAVPRDVAREHTILPLYEDEQRIFIAVENPRAVSDTVREIRFVRGKVPVLHIALHVTLIRTIRACYNARDAGQRLYAGPLASNAGADGRGFMFVISTPEKTSTQSLAPPGVEDITRELDSLDLQYIGDLDEDENASTVETGAYRPIALGTNDIEVTATDELDIDASNITGMYSMAPERHSERRRAARIADGQQRHTRESARQVGDVPSMDTIPPLGSAPRLTPRSIIDLDAGGVAHRARRSGPGHVLIVDDDFASLHLLVKEFEAAGIKTATAGTGGQAIRELRTNPPDVIILDVMLPEMDGFQICQAIKQSEKYNHIGVLLMSAVISTKRVTDDILARYGAEGYYEKPIDTHAIRMRVTELLRASGTESQVSADDSFDRAIAMYKDGYLDRAIELLRTGLSVDPLSPKHHFVLGNLLQKKSLIYEAIEAYEATVDLKPDYFPALTRLAYLYYKKGFSAKAAEVWERSLRYCTDRDLRKNIREFIENVRAEMSSAG